MEGKNKHCISYGYFLGNSYEDIINKVKNDPILLSMGYEIIDILEIKRVFADMFIAFYIYSHKNRER